MKETVHGDLLNDLDSMGAPTVWLDVIRVLPKLTLRQRKGVLLLCRSQVYPNCDTILHHLVHSTGLPPRLIQQISEMCITPLYAGLLCSFVVVAPIDDESITLAFWESAMKEVSVMESTPSSLTINFNPLFGHYDEVVSQYHGYNKPMSILVLKAIQGWIVDCEKKIVYPTISNKTVSRFTARKVEEILCNEWVPIDEGRITQKDLERIYYRHGIKIGGPCELRQKWYPSNLLPRTYFSPGGDAFFVSQHIGKLLTALCDCLVSTERKSRVNPTRLDIREEETLLLYDLSTFTSNLHIQRQFMYQLSLMCKGHEIQIVSVNGLESRDFGDLIWDYTHNQLVEPSYTIERIVKSNLILSHHVAGFLGVYGNISSATFIHGATVLQSVVNDTKLNVAGDDGAICTRDIDNSISCIRCLGSLADEKIFRADQPGSIHLKRPIFMIGQHILQGSLVSWPNLEYFGNEKCTDNRFPSLHTLTKIESKTALSSSVLTFVQSLRFQKLTEWDKEFVLKYLYNLYVKSGLPLGGHVPQLTGKPLGFVPAVTHHIFHECPIKVTLSQHYQNIVKLPDRGVKDLTIEDLEQGRFVCNRSPLLSYLSTLGVVEQTSQRTVWFSELGFQLLLKEYLDPDPMLYQYEVVDTPPLWAFLLINA